MYLTHILFPNSPVLHAPANILHHDGPLLLQENLDTEYVVSTAINKLNMSAGFSEQAEYVQNASANYIQGAASLADADEITGAKIVRKAIEEPVRQIAANAGLEGSVIIDGILRSGKAGYGFNFASEEYTDMAEAGILDPTKVTRSALQNASSVAAK